MVFPSLFPCWWFSVHGNSLWVRGWVWSSCSTFWLHHVPCLITSFYPRIRFFTLLCYHFSDQLICLDSIWVLRGVEARSSLICSGSSWRLGLAHWFKLVCHVYFHVSLVFMTGREKKRSTYFYSCFMLNGYFHWCSLTFSSPTFPLWLNAWKWLVEVDCLVPVSPVALRLFLDTQEGGNLPLWLFTAMRDPLASAIIRSQLCRIILKGQLRKKSSLVSENTYKYPVTMFSVKLMIKEWQILLSELIHVQLFRQYICIIPVFLCKHISDSVGREASVILSRVLLGIQPYSWFSYLYFSTLFCFQESPNAAAGACLRKASPPCWWWCRWISLST